MTGPVSRWEDCPDCAAIPARCQQFEVGGELRSNTIPKVAFAQEVVGAPMVKDDGEAGRHLRRCARCGTVYEWHLSHEYLAGGSEDETVVSRLELAEGAVRVVRLLAELEARSAGLRVQLEEQLESLRCTKDAGVAKEAANRLWALGIIDGLDLSGALQAPGLQSAPSERYAYSNLGMGLVGVALVDQLGLPGFDEALQALLITPLGLRSTGTGTEAFLAGIADHTATGYTAYICFRPDLGLGVVLLCNRGNLPDLASLGLELLDVLVAQAGER